MVTQLHATVEDWGKSIMGHWTSTMTAAPHGYGERLRGFQDDSTPRTQARNCGAGPQKCSLWGEIKL